MRMFIASPVRITPEIESLINSLFNKENFRIIEPNNIHITYLFLGEVNENESCYISGKLEKIIINKISARICGISAFPGINRPRVIVISLESPHLNEVYNSIIDVLPEYKRNNTKFLPHITIARVRKSSIRPDISGLYMDDETLLIDEICLFKTNLTHDGAVYERIMCNKFL